jgi:hypothetical protein
MVIELLERVVGAKVVVAGRWWPITGFEDCFSKKLVK